MTFIFANNTIFSKRDANSVSESVAEFHIGGLEISCSVPEIIIFVDFGVRLCKVVVYQHEIRRLYGTSPLFCSSTDYSYIRFDCQRKKKLCWSNSKKTMLIRGKTSLKQQYAPTSAEEILWSFPRHDGEETTFLQWGSSAGPQKKKSNSYENTQSMARNRFRRL